MYIDAPRETLRQRHPRGLLVPLDTIALYVSQIASALQLAHDQQVLHLDLRPEQLFVGPDGDIILDFTHRLLDSNLPTVIPSDALYMPHESPGPASDQYALAMIIYEWLSGTPPVRDTTNTQRILPVPGEYVATIWSRLEPILSRALDPDPAQRYENVEAFANAFILALNVGPEAVMRWQKSQRQVTGTTLRTGTYSSLYIRPSSQDWHNPFSFVFGYTIHTANTLAFSPDSTRLAFSCGEPEVYIAKMAEHDTPLFTYRGHTDRVSALAWSPDGQAIASLSPNEANGNIQIWEVSTGEPLSTYPVSSSTNKLHWSPDGNFIATGGWDRAVYVWRAFSGESLLTYNGHSNPISSIAWSPDSTRIASASSGEVQVWEVATGRLICTYYGQFGTIGAVAWSPDGTMIVSGSDDATIQIWNATNKLPVFVHRASYSTITALDWSRDGNYVITGTSDNTIQVYEVKDGTSVFSYRAHTSNGSGMGIGMVAWSPDLSMLAVGIDDRRVEIANRATGELLLCRASATPIEKIGQGQRQQSETSTSSSSSTFISNSEITTITETTTTMVPSGPPIVHTTTRQRRTVHVWGGNEGRETITYYGHKSAVKPLSWSPDSGRIASGGYDGTIHVWDALTGVTIFIYRGHLDPVVTLAWSPDGTRLASGSLDHTVKIWDLLTGQEVLTYRGHQNFVQSIAWSPDSTHIVSGSEDNTVQVWHATNGQTITTYNEHTAAISCVDWSLDGQHIASGSNDRTVHIWGAMSGHTNFVYRNHGAAVHALSWSPDGTRVASGSARARIWYNPNGSIQRVEHDARLHIWIPAIADKAVIYGQEEDNSVYHDLDDISWSPDGQMIATVDFIDPRIYDASTGETIALIMNRSRQDGTVLDKLLHVAWSPDGTRIAGSYSHPTVKVWRARTMSDDLTQ